MTIKALIKGLIQRPLEVGNAECKLRNTDLPFQFKGGVNLQSYREIESKLMGNLRFNTAHQNDHQLLSKVYGHAGTNFPL